MKIYITIKGHKLRQNGLDNQKQTFIAAKQSCPPSVHKSG